MKVDKTMVINDIISIDMKGITPILLKAGMHCIGCPSSMNETLGEASFVHGMEQSEIDKIVDEINIYLENSETTK